jgi:stage II sporulation protein D
MKVSKNHDRRLILLIIVILPFAFSLPSMAAPLVQVGLSTTEPTLQLAGQCSVFDSAGHIIAENDAGIQLEAVDGQVWLNGTSHVVLRAVPTGLDSAACIEVNGRPYRGDIIISAVGNKVKVVNELDVEEYLLGVLPLEMPPAWPLEALKAQAVAARTFALKNINLHRNEGFGLCDSSHCQVYGGARVECASSSMAVKETAGMVIKYRGDLIEAYYHASSGGKTETSGAVWGSDRPYLAVVTDEADLLSPYASWQACFSPEQVGQKLASHGYSIGAIQDLEIISRTSSGRADFVEIKGLEGKATIAAATLRHVLGLNSTMFDIIMDKERSGVRTVSVLVLDNTSSFVTTVAAGTSVVTAQGTKTLYSVGTDTSRGRQGGSNIVFRGSGYGHGVGLSQWGAKALAEKGMPGNNNVFLEILTHYYRGVTIEPY